MFYMKLILFLTFSFVLQLSSATNAKQTQIIYDLSDFVEIRSGQSLFVKWKKSKAGKPTIVLINGLTYSTKQWDLFAFHLVESGLGVVQYDMQGMGKTLLQYAPVREVIPWQSQVLDLKALAEKLKLKNGLNLVGLSYGGGVAIGFSGLFPELTKNVFLMAPFTEPIASQDQILKAQVAVTRFWYPYNPYNDDELYDYFLKQNVYSTYPMAEPIVLENPYKLEATFRMVQGIRKLPTQNLIQNAAAKSIHLIIAGQDEYIPRDVHERFWEIVPNKAKASQLVILQSKHKIPEVIPEFSAKWISFVLTGRLKSPGRDQNFEGDVRSKTITGPNGEIDLN